MKVPEIILFTHGRDDFLRALDAAGVRYRWPVDPPGGFGIQASGLPIELVGVTAGAVVAIVRGWLKARAARMAQVQLPDGTSVMTRGMSAEETERVLAEAVKIALIQTEPDAPRQPRNDADA